MYRTLLTALPLAAALWATGCQAKHETKTAPPEPIIQAGRVILPDGSPQLASLKIEPATRTGEQTLKVTGRLVWDDDLTVRLFAPFAGRVAKILAETGRPVAAGDPLALIASPDFGQAQADALKAVNDLRLAEKTLTRVRELFEHGAAPQKDLQQAEADFDRAKNEKDRTLVRLQLYGGTTSLIDQLCPLRSPVSGVVVEKNINPGQEVRPDQMLANVPQFFSPLFVVTDPTRLWVQLEIPEDESPHIKPGQAFRIHARSLGDRTFLGTVEVISDALDPSSRVIRVRGVVDNPDRLLKAEMYVTAEIPQASPPGALDISAKAVFLKGQKHFIFVEEQPGKFSRREVKLGGEREGKVLVVSGLEDGQRVVTDGCLLLEQMLGAMEGS